MAGLPAPDLRVSPPAPQPWRRHIVLQLRDRDQNQRTGFQDLIRIYSRLLEKTSLTKGILGRAGRCPSGPQSSLQDQNLQLRKTTGELAYQVLELQQQIKIKEAAVQDQQDRLVQEEVRRAGALAARQALQERVDQVQGRNRVLKADYDALLDLQTGAEARLREEKLRGGGLVEDMVHLKKEAAARMNTRNERRSRFREATLQKELRRAARSSPARSSPARSSAPISPSSAPSSRSSSPKNQDEELAGRGHTRLFRSSSATSPRLFTSIRGLFGRRRGHSVCSLEETLSFPVGVCVSARVPARALQVLEAHQQGINAVRFSCSSDLLATGGTDRVIKVWELRAGQLTHRATLDGSREGVSCVEFDPPGQRILAGSFDKSALLWRLGDSTPKVTLTGHSRKVTAARFTGSAHQVVTGSADRTVRLWDLQRNACVQQLLVSSYVSDLVCSDSVFISGHFDCRIRVWDSRLSGCVQELPAPGKVTSLDLSSDHRRLLSCCRDDSLQLVDLRGRSQDRVCFRADGFKCGSDSNKAVISPDGCYLAAGSADASVYIWNVSNGNLETRLPDGHSSPVVAVSWSLSGENVVSVDKSRWAVLWSDL
ncbi:protein Atg16l2-like isoform X2 [Cololabis saira]|uniref:protein Atg16l2-like isoform X2 n=1 Tax=Cololabis saira TaxID=129043 RepID=UPI002AD59D19|nr:protein Atg16l2-like isoform X2 [Cololabis saira]